jgi:hypothetical protein
VRNLRCFTALPTVASPVAARPFISGRRSLHAVRTLLRTPPRACARRAHAPPFPAAPPPFRLLALARRRAAAAGMTIRFFLLQNRQGRTRLSKWWVAIEESDKRKIESEVHRLVTSRDSKFTNFVEVRARATRGARRARLVGRH